MDVLYILLFVQGITGQMALYQPQTIVSVDVNGTAVITCVSSKTSIGILFSWYHRKWRSGEDPVRVKSCYYDNDKHKYGCKHEKRTASLEIYNVQTKGSGVYYCTYKYLSIWKFGNGTNLIVGDKFTLRSSVHIVGHLQPHHPHSSLHLACVVLAAPHTVHLSWNISGTYHKGRIISKEESDGTWTVMNFISLPNDNWSHGEKLTCEAWITSTPTRVYWEIPGQGDLHGNVASECQNFLIPVMTVGLLLLLTLSVHLITTLKDTEHNIPSLMDKNIVTEGEIIYSELDINHLTRSTK